MIRTLAILMVLAAGCSTGQADRKLGPAPASPSPALHETSRTAAAAGRDLQGQASRVSDASAWLASVSADLPAAAQEKAREVVATLAKVAERLNEIAQVVGVEVAQKAEAAAVQADALKRDADDARKLAKQEAARADREAARADAEKQRADDAFASKLRSWAVLCVLAGIGCAALGGFMLFKAPGLSGFYALGVAACLWGAAALLNFFAQHWAWIAAGAGLAFVGLMVSLAVAWLRGRDMATTLGIVARAVEVADPDGKLVKDKIGGFAAAEGVGPLVKRTVTTIKAEAGI